MKRIGLRSRGVPALVALTSLGAGFGALHGCIPQPDTSGLPPFDAGVITVLDGSLDAIGSRDTSTDVVVPPSDGGDAGSDAPSESGGGTGTIVGVVIDYTQGAGRGVIPGATVSIVNGGAQTTTDVNGMFKLTGVPVGNVQLNVSMGTDKTNNIAYSTTQLLLSVGDGQTLSVEPVLHEGCVSRFTPSADSGASITASACAKRAGAALSFKPQDAQSLVDNNGAPFTGLVRVELIPLEYPKIAQTQVEDLSWAVALPGASTPTDMIGAGEIRVFEDATDVPLKLANGKTATITLPMSKATQGPLTAYHFDAANGVWAQDNGVTPSNPGTVAGVSTLDLTVPHLTWWAVTAAAPPQGCVSGTLMAGAGPAAGALVHGVGTDWVGVATAVTDSQGNFCLNVPQQTHVTVGAGYVDSSGAPFGVFRPFPGTAATTGACGGTCASLGTINMTAFASGCSAGTINGGAGSPTSDPIDVYVYPITLDQNQKNAGVLDHAYAGQIQAAAGAFCLPTAPGVQLELVDPTDTECQNSNAAFSPTASGPGVCGPASTGCADAGTVNLGCNSLPWVLVP